MNEICRYARGWNAIKCDAPPVVKIADVVSLTERHGETGNNDFYDGLVHDLKIMCSDCAPCPVSSGRGNLTKRAVYDAELAKQKSDELMEVTAEGE